MDEIIAKLRKEEELPPEPLPEPMTARVNKRDVSKTRIETPPENYRSPHLDFKFYAETPE